MRSASRSSDRTRFRASGTRCNRPLIEHPRRVAIGSLKPVAALQLVLACLSAVQAQAQVTPFTMPHAGNLPEQSAPAFYGEEGRGSPAIPLNATMALAANGPATGAPAIMGAASVGQTLTASKGTIADDDGLTRADNGDAGYAYEYQWIRVDGNVAIDIPGETSTTYTLADADEGKRIRVEVSFTDDADNDESRISQPTSAIWPAGPVAVLQATSAVISEGETALFEVHLIAPAVSEVVVRTAFSQIGSFWAEAPPSSVTFAIGETLVEVGVATVDDATIEDAGRIIGRLQPGGGYHVGTHDSVYIEVNDNDALLGICGRTPEVRDRILILLRYRHDYDGDCSGVTDSELAQLTSLDLDYFAIDGLLPGDFEGLSSLTYMSLDDNELTTLPRAVFDGLDALQELRIGGNRLTGLLNGVFVDLPALEQLVLSRNELHEFPFDDLETLPSLTTFHNGGNPGAVYEVQISPVDFTVTGADTVTYRVRLTRKPGGSDPVEITRHAPGSVDVWPEALSFSRADWFRSHEFSLSSSDVTGFAQAITHSVTAGFFPDRAIDTVFVTRPVGSMSIAGGDEPAFAGDAEAVAAVAGLSPSEAAAALFGEDELEAIQLTALDHLGNGNGRYDHGDFMAWVTRCRIGGADCGGERSPGPDGTAVPPNAAAGQPGRSGRHGGAGARGRSGSRGRDRREPSARPCSHGLGARRRRGNRWGAIAVIAMLATWACIGEDPTRPMADTPGSELAEPLLVILEAPTGSRDNSAMLRVDGPGIISVQANAMELYESDPSDSGGRQLVVAGRLASGVILQIRVPAGRNPADYDVELLEVAAEDYSLRDLTGYSASIVR